MHQNSSFLIIDDSYIDRIVTASMLKTTFEECVVHEVNGAMEGLQFLTEKKYQAPLVILLDIKMPKVDGFDFLARLEKTDDIAKEDLAIIMLSSTIDPTDIQKAKENTNVKKLLSKPLSIQELNLVLHAMKLLP
ncbi:response regulator [Chryseosolibacter indicus]|uniref:Response regulator n=1 Tax=Chryseosolibacter indicus TaxID=2782351 RepID=A0ABS5VMD8_9BACT|nr:response regulator [Chryseosolibacter indicus]MBT1702615.1 response regulator [Chryseosolibacter indicus]